MTKPTLHQIANETARAFERACRAATARGMRYDRREALALACEAVAGTDGLDRGALLELVTNRLGLPCECDTCGVTEYERALTGVGADVYDAVRWRCGDCWAALERVDEWIDEDKEARDEVARSLRVNFLEPDAVYRLRNGNKRNGRTYAARVFELARELVERYPEKLLEPVELVACCPECESFNPLIVERAPSEYSRQYWKWRATCRTHGDFVSGFETREDVERYPE